MCIRDRIIDFEREKASHGMFLNGESLDQILAQCNAMLTVDEHHFLITSFSDRLRDCSFVSDSHRTAYEIRNRQIINDCVVPAYQSLITSLGQLRSTQNQALGLYHTPGGLSYFEHLLKYTVGTDLTCLLYTSNSDNSAFVIFPPRFLPQKVFHTKLPRP